MSKLTERLREGATVLDVSFHHEAVSLVIEEAADRIEHLERVLVMARIFIQGGAPYLKPEAIATINEALKEQK